ncbi:ABC transporter permease [Jannaschia seohaensis]|uniref:Simple sugar transport system permease protein n=1 Tax=Jannaschia seohaensis TaxID=475081 RepID=A0A2Y9BW34_9RHOB|nr:ABC transporter permease [Jannaschia seohaensis]PWJ22114.1 simple sugar transport system permease protein [Jannaschia seohaensis]SSA38392.1 simple sugar transport system permease protein [Jannaschia seohaensis]
MTDALPKWADILLIPLINLILALVVSGLVVALIGKDPFEALSILVTGAVGSAYGWGYTLFYATNFIFTGLGVAVAFHARLFNIGGEGQAALGGLGCALVLLYLPLPHWSLAIIAASLGAALFGAAWAAIPAYLQAKRGSHIVITTIMFNFIASALMVYLLSRVLIVPGAGGSPETARFVESVHLPNAYDVLPWMGFSRSTPLNVSFLLAIAACVFVWVLIWRTRLGYEIRAFGQSEPAALYGGISSVRIIMIAMLISGALIGLMAINSVMGEAERLVIDPVQGAGFVGIAVALMGRSHPVGVFLAALLFGALYQGGGELTFEMNGMTREIILVIQALVILFTGALDNMVRAPVERAFLSARKRPRAPLPTNPVEPGGHSDEKKVEP